MNKILFLIFSRLTTPLYVLGEICTENDFSGILSCIYGEYDNQLNELYENKLKTLNVRQQNKLKKSQRKWAKKTESECNKIVDEESFGKKAILPQVNVKSSGQRMMHVEKWRF